MQLDRPLGQALGLVGRSYAEFNCWGLVRECFRIKGVELPAEYFEAYRSRRFASVAVGMTDLNRGGTYVPQPWDIAVFRTHLFVTLHVGVCLGGKEFIHSLDEETGVSVGFLDRAPWKRVVAGFMRVVE